MAAQKLFGSSSSARFSSGKHSGDKPQKAGNDTKKKGSRLKPLKITLVVLLVLEILYCIAIFSNIPFIARLRNMYIETAMSTMSHQWLATAFIPHDIVDEVVSRTTNAREEQMGQNSTWGDPKNDTTKPTQPAANTGNKKPEKTLPPEQEKFFDLFWELDQSSMLSYVKENPQVVADGWDKIKINEAGLDDEGTSIRTTMGEQVLAIDAENQILLVRVSGSSYRGVLAIAKDPSRMKLAPSEYIGSVGQHAGEIAEANGGILAMTGSGFIDEGGGGNGGALAGACMCSGESYGTHYGWGYKRIELHEDNRLYLTDASDYFGEKTTDAVEFWPALIIDGKNALGADNIFTEMNPRACLGQSDKEELLLLVIEGRMASSLGTDAQECVDILLRHHGYQAMNLDGGTSAIMWYDGEYITKCSNQSLDAGRYLPNAWVYCDEPVK